MARIVKSESPAAETPLLSLSDRDKLKKWVAGELTWAEVEGMSWEDAKAMAQVACDLAAAGRLEEARAIFEGMVEVNPKDAAAHSALGTVYQKLARPEAALTEYGHALALDPENPVALANRGELRLKQGDPGGCADLALAIASDPEGRTSAGRRASAIAKALALVAAEQGGLKV